MLWKDTIPVTFEMSLKFAAGNVGNFNIAEESMVNGTE
jgi:hypothetical protein